MTGFYVDFSDINKIRESAGASQGQMIAAFNRALKRTAAKLQRQSVALMISETAARSKSRTNRRVRAFTVLASKDGAKPGSGKVWFGLNDMPVGDLKGRIRSQRKIKTEDRKRDSRGRFIEEKGSRGATFIPAASGLNATTYLNSFAGTVRGKKSIWIRSGNGHVHEAMLPIHHQLMDKVGDEIGSEAGEMLMKYYEQDLRGRVAGGIK